MSQDRAIIGRFHFSEEGIILPPEYLCFEPALLAAVEWYWSEERAKALVFAHHGEADRRADELRKETGKSCFALVLGSGQLAEERKRRHESRDGAMEASVARHRVSPQEAYAELERRHLD